MAGSFLDPILGWVLNFHPLVGIIIISFIISLIVTLAMKFLTDQKLMKDLKGELKELQKEMKELRNNPKKLAKVNSQFMETNMKYMSHSMRPTLFTFLPIIIIFGWLNSHLAYVPIGPDEPFQLIVEFEEQPVDMTLLSPEGIKNFEGPFDNGNKIYWIMEGDAGEHTLHLEGVETENSYTLTNPLNYTKDVIITEGREYAPVEKDLRQGFLFFMRPDDNGVNYIKLNNEKIKPFSDVPVFKDIPWVKDWGWLLTYILFSIVFSMVLRRILKIY